MKRRFFAVFLACSLVFHLSLISIVVLFDPTRELSTEVIEIPVELVSEGEAQKSGPKGASGQRAEANAQSPAPQNQSPGSSSETASKPDTKPAASADKPAEAPAKPAEKPQTQPEKPSPPVEQQANAAENKPAEAKPAEPRPAEKDNKPAEAKAKPAENKPARNAAVPPQPAAKTQPAPAQKETAQKQPAPEPPKPAEPKAPAQPAAQQPPAQQQAQPQPPQQAQPDPSQAQAAAEPPPAQEPQKSAAAMLRSQIPTFYQPSDRLSLAIPAPMATDDTEAEAVPYKLLVFGMLERAKEYPESARNRHATGHVVISFSVDDEGVPFNISMIRSSGEPDLDEEASLMIVRAAPYPVPPAGAQRDFAVDIGFGGS